MVEEVRKISRSVNIILMLFKDSNLTMVLDGMPGIDKERLNDEKVSMLPVKVAEIEEAVDNFVKVSGAEYQGYENKIEFLNEMARSNPDEVAKTLFAFCH